MILGKISGISLKRPETHRFHVEYRWFHKARAEVFNDEGGNAERDTVGTHSTHYQHFLELITLTLPIT